MARLPRIVIPNRPHHLTQQGVRSIAIFRHDGDRQRYLRFMAEETARFGLDILAWCLLRDHVHLVGVPRQETSLARAVGNAHRRFTRERNFEEGVRGYLFQGRFSSCALDERHLLASLRHTLLAPVVLRQAKRPWEFEWSSAAFHTGRRRKDPLVHSRSLGGLVRDWKKLLAEEDPEADRNLKLCIRTGRPAGSPQFIVRMEKLTGMRLRKRKPGPKPKPEK
ncbi:MAG TPA: transposase [Planctomycetota bacterium]|nr:transposase [Planctomycetota bacterium]